MKLNFGPPENRYVFNMPRAQRLRWIARRNRLSSVLRWFGVPWYRSTAIANAWMARFWDTPKVTGVKEL